MIDDRMQQRMRLLHQEEARCDEASDGCDLEDHEYALYSCAGLDSEAVDAGQDGKREHDDPALGDWEAGQFKEISREGYSDSGHAAGLNHKQQYPSIQEPDSGMIGLAQIDVLAADLGH